MTRADETSETTVEPGTAVMDPTASREGSATAEPNRRGVATEGSGQPSSKQDVKKAEFQPLSPSALAGETPGMDLLLDVTLPVSVELGRTRMTIKEVLALCPGSVVELDRAAGDTVDVLVSGKVIGKGEVVVVEEKFGVRISELVNRVAGIKKT